MPTKTAQPAMLAELSKAVKTLRTAYTLTEREAVELIANDAPLAQEVINTEPKVYLPSLATHWLDGCEVYAAHYRVKDCREAGVEPDPVDRQTVAAGHPAARSEIVAPVAVPSEQLRIALADAARQYGYRTDRIAAAAAVAERRDGCDYGNEVAYEATGYLNHLLPTGFSAGWVR